MFCEMLRAFEQALKLRLTPCIIDERLNNYLLLRSLQQDTTRSHDSVDDFPIDFHESTGIFSQNLGFFPNLGRHQITIVTALFRRV